MTAMENDEFRIPEQYRKMSVAQLDQEAKKILEQIKNTPKNVQRKKKAAPGRKEIMFHI